ncbi:WcaF family extracellular polysaccharide biosynthesis acetyltransferase [Methylovulum miyakonense]|uniref:WcaF family extracellular polysaccharide biosynthesis acetyltransferase n=1 Tax=Methylovulum miyakonense TaxID=645578 RepID=UPI00037524B6|nr:WcaF family extracellular polysaccharide biosynthesis acetyltransferase [Methylovulum miyakonense]
MKYNDECFLRGRGTIVEGLWIITQWLFVSSWLPGSFHRCLLLRLFGARIGNDVIIKPRVRIKFPWRLVIGCYSWIGEAVWIDNLDQVTIGSNTCLSQGVYVCTGSHDWGKIEFNLIVKPVVIEDQVWIAAKAILSPGTVVRQGAILTMGSMASKELDPWTIYAGIPAKPIREREV